MTKTNRGDHNTSFLKLRETVENFCKQRDWQNNDPKQLLLSAFIELGELAEYYQWTKDGDWQKDKKKEVAFELVDVFFYLLRFINKTEIDFSEHFFEKVEKLSQKYPTSQIKLGGFDYKKIKEDYRRTGKNKLYE